MPFTILNEKDAQDRVIKAQERSGSPTFLDQKQQNDLDELQARRKFKKSLSQTTVKTLDDISGAIVKSKTGIILLNRLKGDTSTASKLDIELKENKITDQRELKSLAQKNASKKVKNYRDSIVIVNLDAGPNADKQGLDRIVFDAVPHKLEMNPKSNFRAIASIGRNNPHYQYLGSEDTLEMVIDWYTIDQDREKVIKQCRRVESLSKANGYKSKPPRISLLWGEQDRLFGGDTWIVVAAPYSLSNFQRGHINNAGRLIKTGSLPQQAIQTVTLKRITNSNRLTSEIVNLSKSEQQRLLDEIGPTTDNAIASA